MRRFFFKKVKVKWRESFGGAQHLSFIVFCPIFMDIHLLFFKSSYFYM
jgi:hypothetical protein